MRFSKKLSELIVKKSVQKKTESKDLVWLLNLDMIEQNTGSVIEKNYVPMSEVGNSTHFFEKGTVLYSKLRPYLNKVVVADSDGYATTELVPLKCNEELISPHYLAYFLRSPEFLEFASNVVAGAKMPRMVMSEFWDYEISIPTIEEQHRILSILDKADAIRQRRQQAIAKLDELLQATFIDMFGDPIKNEKGWPKFKLENLASNTKYSIKAGPFGSALKKEDYVANGYKIYGQEQVIRDDFEYGDYYISEEKYESLKNCAITEGDVLISLVGTFGKISVVPKNFEEGIINPRLMKITFDTNKISPYFAKYLLTTKQMLAVITSFSHGGTMGIVNVGIMKNIELILPPLDLQEKFIKIMLSVFALKEKNQQAIDSNLFESLQQKAFNGTL